MPEWKEAVLGKNPTYGRVTSMTILEQRQSLPIYQLRDELLKAIDENQVTKGWVRVMNLWVAVTRPAVYAAWPFNPSCRMSCAIECLETKLFLI
jgi:hypothetical protein